MTPERDQRVYAAFEAALECDPARRAGLLEERCADDPELRAKVERLLVQDTEAERDGFLATPDTAARDALRFYGSTDGESEIDYERHPDVTSDARPSIAAAPPRGLAEHPDYEIKRELGRGGMGIVYLAQNRIMGRNEVLKVLGRQIMERPGGLERFLREIRAVATLRHPNIVTAYSASRYGESTLLAMEYVDGPDLAEVVRSRGPLSVADASNYVYQALLGLQHAHEHGMVHRDLKPSNLVLTREGDRDVVKVLDFGLAKVNTHGRTDGTLTYEGQMLGTPDFIAPEQIRNSQAADIRADIYSLGCTLYFLLAGGPPFARTCIYDTLQAHHSADATPLSQLRPDVPVELNALVSKMMAKEPEQRFQTPAEAAEALTPFLEPQAHYRPGSGPIVASDGQTAPPPQTIDVSHSSAPVARRRRVVAFATAASLLAAVVAASVMSFKTRNGTIVFENLPVKSVVTVDGDALRVEWPEGKGKRRARVTIPPGRHWVEVKVDGVQVSGERVSVGWGGVAAIVVRIDEAPSVTEPPAPPATRSSTPRPNLESFVNTLGMEMKLIPAGPCEIGSPDTDRDAADDEKPRHQVRITRSFLLGATEVTQGQYRAVTGTNPSINRGSDQLPVDNVTWDDAVAFCGKLSAREGLKPYYQAVTRATLGGDGYRLPNEAEWEYACRAGSATRYCFGDEVGNFGGETTLEHFAWYNRNSDERSHEVGTKKANAFGLFDMHGNVWELCSDGYDARYYLTAPEADPFAPVARDGLRATRGGCFNDYDRLLRSALRRQDDPERGRHGALGFRVARWTRAALRPDAEPTGGAVTGGKASFNQRPAPPVAGDAVSRSNPESFVNTVGMKMKLVPAGSFMMGSPDSDFEASPDERPQHRVRISKPFYLGIHEVTRGQFRRFVSATGYRTEAERYGRSGLGWNGRGDFEPAARHMWLNPGFEQTDEHPVVLVTWNDASEFCRWLSQTESRIYRLPTEAQWEYACRAGSTTRYFSGDDPETLAAVANVADGTARESFPRWRETISARDGFVHTAPVGQLRPNAFGLYDMHGNVWEWCNDGYDEKYYGRSPGADPSGSPHQASDRVTRGGGWVDRSVYFRSAERQRGTSSSQIAHQGFRVVLELAPSK